MNILMVHPEDLTTFHDIQALKPEETAKCFMFATHATSAMDMLLEWERQTSREGHMAAGNGLKRFSSIAPMIPRKQHIVHIMKRGNR